MIRGKGLLAKRIWLYLPMGGLILMAGCIERENKYVPPPPPEVTVSRPVKRPVIEYLEFTGNTQAYETVDLKARVEGFLTKLGFKDGDIVKKDQLLFVIEPPPYEAKVRLAEANLASAQARLLRANQEYQRQLQLIKQNATSQATVEKWQAERDAAKAMVDESKANLDLARITLSYTQVRAPFHGRIDRRLVDPGNLVGSGKATLLATIRMIDPIYAYFNLNERDLVRIMEKHRQEGNKEKMDVAVPVYLGIEGEDGFPHEGKLDFAATTLDATTGTLLLRAIFNNPLKSGTPRMVPGMFVRVRFAVDIDKNGLLVPDRALGTDQGGRYVLVVTDQDVVEHLPVKAGPLEGQLRVIREGLKGDERVVVKGTQRARPGMKVKSVQLAAGPAALPSSSESVAPPAAKKP